MVAFRAGPRRAAHAKGAAPALRAACIAFALAVAGTAAATPGEADPDTSAWVGRYCTPLGCSASVDSALGNAVGFGAAALTVGWLARRRRA